MFISHFGDCNDEHILYYQDLGSIDSLQGITYTSLVIIMAQETIRRGVCHIS